MKIQAWMDHVYPLLEDHLASSLNSITTYSLLFYHAAAANMLEV